VFLPATTFLEEHDVMASYGHNYVGPVNKVIEPVGECRSDYAMFMALARRFQFADRFERTAEAWLEDICSPIRQQGCSMVELKVGPFRLDAAIAPYTDKTFLTASGRFEFMTSFDPDDLTPATSDAQYPYSLLTIAPHKFICSERTMADHPPLPVVRLHPSEATGRGLEDGAIVIVRSPVGRVRARLQTDAGVRRDCLVSHRGGWIKAGHGLNRLTRDMASKVGEGTPYYETRVTIEACKEELGESVQYNI
jgi:anaerobic selenocysteine-containing dehydrogenase